MSLVSVSSEVLLKFSASVRHFRVPIEFPLALGSGLPATYVGLGDARPSPSFGASARRLMFHYK
jgi:hypothetical protein